MHKSGAVVKLLPRMLMQYSAIALSYLDKILLPLLTDFTLLVRLGIDWRALPSELPELELLIA